MPFSLTLDYSKLVSVLYMWNLYHSFLPDALGSRSKDYKELILEVCYSALLKASSLKFLKMQDGIQVFFVRRSRENITPLVLTTRNNAR